MNVFENVFDSVNDFVSVNVFDSVGVNVSVGIGMQPSTAVPLETLILPNVSLRYVSNVITCVAATFEKALDETVGGVSP